MSTANPTGLKIGASGTLDGHRCTVTGRVVMGVTIDGETYYWNEYQLADDSGFTAILVYEEEETGPAWKLFIPLELPQGFSALEAARYKVGDSVVFGDTRAQVSLISQSRVYFIEGEAPEGVEVGDVADYFNAQAGNRMLVASWTGSEIEYYRGRTLPTADVPVAFGLPKPGLSMAALQRFSGGGQSALSGGAIKGVLFGFLALVAISARSCSSGPKVQPPPARIVAGASPIVLGSRGQLAGHDFTVLRHATAAISAPGGDFERHEFLLSSGPDHYLLLKRIARNVDGWFLLSPVPTPAGVTAYTLAALPVGATLAVEGKNFTVTSLFRGTSARVEGAADWDAPGQTYYGLAALAASGERLLARWTETHVDLQVGPILGEKDVLAALAAKP